MKDFNTAPYKIWRSTNFDAIAEPAIDFLTELNLVVLRVTVNGSHWDTLSFTEEEWEKIKVLVDGVFSGKLQGLDNQP
jgi:hypothetical protein